MNGNLGRDKLWDEQIWSEIDSAVRDEMGRVRVAQKVFPCTILSGGQPISADKMVSGKLEIVEGETKAFVEIWGEFSLTQGQVENEAILHTGRTLARMAANKLALAEDALLFRGEQRAIAHHSKFLSPSGGAGIIKTRNASHLGKGLLGEDPGVMVSPYPVLHSISVAYSKNAPEDIVAKVLMGIAELSSKGHAGPYALFLPLAEFAAASAPTAKTMIAPADRITPLVPGGFFGTSSLSNAEGLLVSLGGEPTTIYLGIDATTAFTQVEANGICRFRVFERIQFVARDHEAFVRLAFA